jgi:predicted Fe-Mo cluster-binding NifX family protein
MRIAIPHWQGRVSPVFDAAGVVLLVEIEEGRELSREEKRLARTDPLGRAAEVSGFGAEVLICGAISAALEAGLASAGVRVIGFVCGAIEDVLDAFRNGELARPTYRMPGCGSRGGRLRNGGIRMPRGFGMGSRGGVGRGGGGRGRMGGPYSAGPGGTCVCPNCGHKAPHAPGQPCQQISCPKCGTSLTRS